MKLAQGELVGGKYRLGPRLGRGTPRGEPIKIGVRVIEQRVVQWWIRIFILSWEVAVISARLAVGMAFLILLFLPSVPILLVLLPWRVARIYATNVIGKVVGRTLMWLTGCPVIVDGLSAFAKATADEQGRSVHPP